MRQKAINENKDLKVQLPVPIDSKKYLIGNFSFKDLLIITPFALLSVILGYLFFLIGILNVVTIVFATLPVVIGFFGQTLKHPIRKEIPFFVYKVMWQYNFSKRKKLFSIEKGALHLGSATDTRRKIPIKNVYANCYETKDKRFIKVFEVGTINMSLMNIEEQREILNAFKNFMNTLNFVNEIQFPQIAQPISLEKHILTVERKNLRETNKCKMMLNKAYAKSMDEDIQKSKDLVSRKRYVVISEKVGTNREKSLNEITTKGQMFLSKLQSVDFGYTNLSVKELNNDELIKLMFVCIDYDNAVSLGDHIVSRATDKSDVSLGEQTAKNLIETLQKNLTERIN